MINISIYYLCYLYYGGYRSEKVAVYVKNTSHSYVNLTFLTRARGPSALSVTFFWYVAEHLTQHNTHTEATVNFP